MSQNARVHRDVGPRYVNEAFDIATVSRHERLGRFSKNGESSGWKQTSKYSSHIEGASVSYIQAWNRHISVLSNKNKIK